MYTWLNINSITTFRSPALILFLVLIATSVTAITGIVVHNTLHLPSTHSSVSVIGEIDESKHQYNQIYHQSRVAALTQQKVDFSQLPNLTRQGHLSWTKEALTLNEPNHASSQFTTQLYLPLVKRPAPVIVISPGLVARPDNPKYLAQRLASYGFAVALLGSAYTSKSNSKSLFDYWNGVVHDEKSQPQEYINRALRIKTVLDELQKRSQSDPNFQVNAQQVGVIGLSFKGSTALTRFWSNYKF